MTLDRRQKLVGAGLLAALVATGAVRIAYGDYLVGPELRPTPDSISLRRAFPGAGGWTPELLESGRSYADSLGAQSVIILWRNMVVVEWGETDRRIDLHSVRKSVLSALYGIAVERGLVDLNATLRDLGVEERDPPLSELEASARLVDLLTSTSGVYHPSVKDDNGPYPAPGTHSPGEAFIYNNWSFNAAGILFERQTGMSIGSAIRDWIAEPIGMEDFRVEDVRYFRGPGSVFPAWRIWMSGRDLARFAALYAREGRWAEREVVPSHWVRESLVRHADAGDGIGYGYMWWIMPDDSYLATGAGGQKIRIYPEDQLVVVTRVDTGDGWTRALWSTFGRSLVENSSLSELVRRVRAAGPL